MNSCGSSAFLSRRPCSDVRRHARLRAPAFARAGASARRRLRAPTLPRAGACARRRLRAPPPPRPAAPSTRSRCTRAHTKRARAPETRARVRNVRARTIARAHTNARACAHLCAYFCALYHLANLARTQHASPVYARTSERAHLVSLAIIYHQIAALMRGLF